MSLKLLLGVNEVYNKNYSYLHQSTWTVRCMETIHLLTNMETDIDYVTLWWLSDTMNSVCGRYFLLPLTPFYYLLLPA